jgi:hypothetical protein
MSSFALPTQGLQRAPLAARSPDLLCQAACVVTAPGRASRAPQGPAWRVVTSGRCKLVPCWSQNRYPRSCATLRALCGLRGAPTQAGARARLQGHRIQGDPFELRHLRADHRRLLRQLLAALPEHGRCGARHRRLRGPRCGKGRVCARSRSCAARTSGISARRLCNPCAWGVGRTAVAGARVRAAPQLVHAAADVLREAAQAA